MNSIKNGRVFIISGPSGVGKGTLLAEFLKKNNTFRLSTSVTTRKRRPNEIKGVNYYFITFEEFQEMIENHRLLEWAEFSGNFYGTPGHEIIRLTSKGINVILEIEVQGALQVKEKVENAVSIFILPPSIQELEARLRGRKTEDEAQIQQRLKIMIEEISESDKFDHCIVNDNLNTALEELTTIINKELAE